MSTLSVEYIIGVVVTVFFSFLAWIDPPPHWDRAGQVNNNRRFARNVLRAPIWPLTLLTMLGKGIGWLAIAATRKPEVNDAPAPEVKALSAQAAELRIRLDELQAIADMAASRRKQGAVHHVEVSRDDEPDEAYLDDQWMALLDGIERGRRR